MGSTQTLRADQRSNGQHRKDICDAVLWSAHSRWLGWTRLHSGRLNFCSSSRTRSQSVFLSRCQSSWPSFPLGRTGAAAHPRSDRKLRWERPWAARCPRCGSHRHPRFPSEWLELLQLADSSCRPALTPGLRRRPYPERRYRPDEKLSFRLDQR